MVGRTSPRSLLLTSFLLLAVIALRDPLRETALTLLRFPFSLVRAGVAIVLLLPRVPALSREHDAMRQELLQARLELAQAREEGRQAGRLQGLRQMAAQGTVVSVIGRSIVPTQHTLVVDGGASRKVVEGGTVVELEGVVGRVIDVQPRTAVVELLTDPESRVAALIERTREFGLLVGRGDGRCDLIYLDANADVQLGDRVLTAGFGGTFPKGVLLGLVTHVARDVSTGSSRAIVQPSVRLNRVEEALYLPPAPAGEAAP